MKMKHYKTIYATALLLLAGAFLFTGCAKDEAMESEKEAAQGKALLTIVPGVSEAAATRADEPSTDVQNKNGSWIENMTVFFFAPDAADDATPLLVKTAETVGKLTMTNQVGSVELTGQELGPAGIRQGETVDIYAITNHIPTDAASLTKKQVMELTVGLPEYVRSGGVFSLVPMSGAVKDYTLTEQAGQQARISLHRSVVRVKITVVDGEYEKLQETDPDYYWTLMDVKLYNDYAATYLWNEGIPATPACRTEAEAIDRDMKVADEAGSGGYPDTDTYDIGNYFYINCNEASEANPSPSNLITVKLRGGRSTDPNPENGYEHTVFLKRPPYPAGDPRVGKEGEFPRNTYLNVKITLKAKGYDTDVQVVPWNVDTEEPEFTPTGIRFDSTTMSDDIPKNGVKSGVFTFDNPLGIPFKLCAFEGDTYNAYTGEPLATFTPAAGNLNEVTVTGIPANETGKNRYISFWFQSNETGEWVDTGLKALQRSDATVNVLYCGLYGQTVKGTYPAKLGAANPNIYSTGSDWLFYRPGNPFTVQTGCTLQAWSLYNADAAGRNYTATIGGKSMNIGEILEHYAIDVLVLCEANGTPDAEQTAMILAWLEADPNRVLMAYATHYTGTAGSNNVLINTLGIGGMSSTTMSLPLTMATEDEFARDIFDGAFGTIADGTAFRAYDAKFGILAAAAAPGFIPLLKNDAGNYYLSVNPDKRIIIAGDIDAPQMVGSNLNNVFTPNATYGPFARLYANLWSWMVETVVLDRPAPNPPVKP